MTASSCLQDPRSHFIERPIAVLYFAPFIGKTGQVPEYLFKRVGPWPSLRPCVNGLCNSAGLHGHMGEPQSQPTHRLSGILPCSRHSSIVAGEVWQHTSERASWLPGARFPGLGGITCGGYRSVSPYIPYWRQTLKSCNH